MRQMTVTAERSGKWWILESIEAGCVSQCRALSQVDDEMREAIAYQLGTEDFEIVVEVALSDEYRELIAQAERLRSQADAANKQASQAWHTAAQTLANQNVSVRDIGHIMGVSHQRAAQLVSA